MEGALSASTGVDLSLQDEIAVRICTREHIISPTISPTPLAELLGHLDGTLGAGGNVTDLNAHGVLLHELLALVLVQVQVATRLGGEAEQSASCTPG